MGLEPGGVSPWGKLLLQPILKKLLVVTHAHSGLIIHGELISAVNITDCYFPLTRFRSGSYIECNEIGETISPPAHFATATLMDQPTTTLTFTKDQLERLVDALEGREEAAPLHNGITETERDVKEHDMLTLRLYKALDRVTRKPGRTKSERVHLPKIEALLNELL